MRNFRNYKVWEESHNLVIDVYRITKEFPNNEIYSLVSQMRHSVISIPTNIAEGSGKESEKDFARYISIAIGSSSEIDYLIELSKDLNYIDKDEYKSLNKKISDIRKQLFGFYKKLKNQ